LTAAAASFLPLYYYRSSCFLKKTSSKFIQLPLPLLSCRFFYRLPAYKKRECLQVPTAAAAPFLPLTATEVSIS
jgi:hypothetical protein